MDNLPPEILSIIFENLDTFDLLSVRQVCHKYNQISSHFIKLELRIEHITDETLKLLVKPFKSSHEKCFAIGSDELEEVLCDLKVGKFDFIMKNACKVTARSNSTDIAPLKTFLEYLKENQLGSKLQKLYIVTDLKSKPSKPLEFLNWVFETFPDPYTSLVINIEKSDEKFILNSPDKLILGSNVQEISLNTFTFCDSSYEESYDFIQEVSYDFILPFIECPLNNNIKSISLSDAASHLGEYQAIIDLPILDDFVKKCSRLERMSINFKVVGANSIDQWLPNGVTHYKGNWFYQLDPDWFEDMDETRITEFSGLWGPM